VVLIRSAYKRDSIQYPPPDSATSKRLETMASLIISSSVSLTHSQPSTPTRAFFKPPHVSKPRTIRFPGDPSRRRTRGLTAVTRAGLSTNYYIFAFALPFSLLAITIFASIRVADKLDRDYLQEVREIYLFLFFEFYVFGWL
jgi:hypothetical protein